MQFVGQCPHGAFSTWGYDERFERPFSKQDWYANDAYADKTLIKLNAYVKSIKKGKQMVPDLSEC